MDSISLAYVYGWRNSGDLAINQGSIKFLNSLFPSSAPRAVFIHPEKSDEYDITERKLGSSDLEYELVGGPMHYDPKTQSTLESLVHLGGDGIRYTMDRLRTGAIHGKLETRMTETIRNSDFFFYNGGNLIHHDRNLPYLLGILYPIQIARQFDVPYGIFPHTIFDLEGRYQRLITSLLEGAEFVWTRDNRSYNYLTSEFSLSCPIRNGIDTAFFSDADTVRSTGRPAGSDRRKIAVVPRFSTLGDTAGLETPEMEHRFKQLLAELATDYDVNITVQTKVEEEWVRENEGTLRDNDISVFKSFSPDKLRAHYKQVDGLITMRLHAGIFALSVGTPSIGLYREEWGPKTPGTWENLGIERYSLPYDDTTNGEVLSLCQEIMDDRESISERIANSIDEKREYMISETKSCVSVLTDNV